jgi:nucleoredoxin
MLFVMQCPPCRAFTPELIATYNKLKEAGRNFEVIFVSSDRDEESMKEYYKEMPWLAVPYDDPRQDQLSENFGIDGIATIYRQPLMTALN